MTQDQLEIKFLTKEEYKKFTILMLGGVRLPAWMVRMYSIAFSKGDMKLSEFCEIKVQAMKEWDDFTRENAEKEYEYNKD